MKTLIVGFGCNIVGTAIASSLIEHEKIITKEPRAFEKEPTMIIRSRDDSFLYKEPPKDKKGNLLTNPKSKYHK